VEVSGTTRISALVEEEEERTKAKEKTKAKESSRIRKDSGQAKGQAKGQGQKEERVEVRRMDAGRVAGRILGMSVRMLEARQGRRDALVSSRSVPLEAYVQLERARVGYQRRGAKKRSSWYLCVPKRVSLNQQCQYQHQRASTSTNWPVPVKLKQIWQQWWVGKQANPWEK